jgi:gingipain R
MKKVFLFALTAVSVLQGFSQKKSSVKILSESKNQIIIEMRIGEVSKKTVSTPQGDMMQFSFEGASMLQKEGVPSLPILAKSILIPNQSNSELQIIDGDYVEYHNIEIAPCKRHITRKEDPSTVPFVFGKEYEMNELFPNTIASLNKPYVFRDYRGQTIQFFPFQYNPVSKTMMVCNRLKIEINFSGTSTENIIATNEAPAKIVDEFDEMYKIHFLNYASKPTRYSPIKEVGSLLVVCPNKYLTAIAPFVKWKEMKGIKTYLVDADTITGGATETTLVKLAKYYYNTHQIAYMQLVGDNTDLPAMNEASSSTTLFGPSDMGYAYISNNDHRPEFIVGRFSGNTIADIETQIQRTLNYEKTPKTTGTWMGTQIGIASTLGPNDDNQYDYEHIHDIVDSNKNQYNYGTNVELYDGTAAHGGTDAAGYPNSTMLLSAINTGASLINYCGHGASDGIVTCNFTSTQVGSINNVNELPFFLVVGCQPGNFINQTSFSENIIRAGGTTPKGVISCFMSTVDQWIPEPMQAQDEFNAVMRGARAGNVRNRFGALCVSGTLSMIDQYDVWPDLGGSEMADTWVFFGDPTVSLFNKFEGTLSVTNMINVEQNRTSLDVQCPVDGATIGLYYQGKYLASGIVSGGVANLTFPPVTGLDTIYITATKQNYAPGYGTAAMVNWPLGTTDISFDDQFSIFPNPTTGKLNIASKNASAIETVMVYDLSGRKLCEKNIQGQNGFVDMTSFSNGVYFVHIKTKDGMLVSKFTKE